MFGHPRTTCPTCLRRNLDRLYTAFQAKTQELAQTDEPYPAGAALTALGVKCLKCRMLMVSRTQVYTWPQLPAEQPPTVRLLPPTTAERVYQAR